MTTVLEAIDNWFTDGNTPLNPGALIMEDDRPVSSHVHDAALNVQKALRLLAESLILIADREDAGNVTEESAKISRAMELLRG